MRTTCPVIRSILIVASVSSALLIVATGLTSSATAAVIFNNGSPQLIPVPAQGALFADPGNANYSGAADDFSLASGQNVIRDIHWWGTYGVTPSDAFAINIYNDSAGTVGSLNTAVSISSLQRTDTGLTINGREMYLYDAVVSDITLTAGTTYWLGIANTSGGTGSNAWAWVDSANSGGNARQYSISNAAWGNSSGKSLAFNLTNTVVPEPSTFALILLGLMGVSFVALRKKNRRA